MTVTFKQILVLQGFQDALAKLKLNTEDYAVLSKLQKVVKKLIPHIEEMQEMVEDLRLDHCYKEGTKIVRENGQLQWTAEGEKAFRKAYKELLTQEVDVDVQPLNYADILHLLPPNAGDVNNWDDVKDSLSPFFEMK